MLTHLFVRVDGFEGGFSCRVTTREWSELSNILDELAAAIRDRGVWGNSEGNVGFELRLDGDVAYGKYRFNVDWDGPVLTGSFTIERGRLTEWAEHARRAMPPSC